MAVRVTRSSSLMVLLVALVVGVQALPRRKHVVEEKHVEFPSTDHKSAEPPFDADQYKEYLSNLKCKEMQILHAGFKVPEVATGTIYQPTTTPQPLPPLPSSAATEATSEKPVAPSLLTTNAPTTKPTRKVRPSSQHKYPEYEDDMEATSKTSVAPAPPTTKAPTTRTTTKVSAALQDKYPEYEEDVDKNEEMPEINNKLNSTAESVLLSGASNVTEECTAPLSYESTNYNWYQVLLDNGGPPGGYLQKGLKSNLTKAVDPCSRPVLHLPPAVAETTFEFTHAEFEKVYRSEQVQVRFPGTPLEFLDVSGRLIWSPPGFTRRYFHFSYRKDDTGLYFDLDRSQRCVFKSDTHVRVECDYSSMACDCVNGKESCFSLQPAAGIPSGLAAALVGGGR